MADSAKTNILPVKHTTFVLQRLEEQRQRGTFCDVTLIVEGEKFRAHRSFLAANSDYFLSLFTSAEEQQNFVLAGVPLRGFRVILDFVYTSTFVLNVSNVHDVYKASSALEFKHVQAACEKVYRKIKQMERCVPTNRSLPVCVGEASKRQLSGDFAPIEVRSNQKLTPTPSPPLTISDSSPLRPSLKSENASFGITERKFNAEQASSNECSPTGWRYIGTQGPQFADSLSPHLRNSNEMSSDTAKPDDTTGFKCDTEALNQFQLKRKIKSEPECQGYNLYPKENMSTKRCKKEYATGIFYDEQGKNKEGQHDGKSTGARSLNTSPDRSDTETILVPFSSRLSCQTQDRIEKSLMAKEDHCQNEDKCVSNAYCSVSSSKVPMTQKLRPQIALLPAARSSNGAEAGEDTEATKGQNDYRCSFKTDFNSNVHQDSAISEHAEGAFQTKATFSAWKLAAASDFSVHEAASGENAHAKGHRNRRKMLKTTKVCTNVV
ncbi:unnamed protein product [Clavelina lepadiformis]|uniref:BTB domain-containing protein n=1 Tax=Clavelina lepadiformis TaxID=159417 RepID=A0ABP0GFS0_CLALP